MSCNVFNDTNGNAIIMYNILLMVHSAIGAYNDLYKNEWGFRPPLCTNPQTPEDGEMTALQTQDSKFEFAIYRSRRLPTIMIFTSERGRCFNSLKREG